MDIHIGSEIAEVAKQKRISTSELADSVNTGVRNMYQILQKDDILISQLWNISERLNYNFFELFHPPISNTQKIAAEPEVDYSGEKKLKIHLELEYPIRQSNELGKFIMQVHTLAAELGFKIV